jgi:hypothetical protein
MRFLLGLAIDMALLFWFWWGARRYGTALRAHAGTTVHMNGTPVHKVAQEASKWTVFGFRCAAVV